MVSKTQSHMNLYVGARCYQRMLDMVDRMQKMRKVCGSKCKAFSVSLLSHASVTPNFKYAWQAPSCVQCVLIYTQDKDKKRSNAEKTRTKIGQENNIRTARNKDKEKKKKKHKLQLIKTNPMTIIYKTAKLFSFFTCQLNVDALWV